MTLNGPSVDRVLEACLYVRDVAEAERFYHEVLGLTVHSPANGRDAFFRCGNTMFLVFNPERTRDPSVDFVPHGAVGSGHVAFAVTDEDIEKWRVRLKELQVEIEKEVSWPNGARSIYFRDPSNNSVELATPRLWGISK